MKALEAFGLKTCPVGAEGAVPPAGGGIVTCRSTLPVSS
jgi:hypothetical protein